MSIIGRNPGRRPGAKPSFRADRLPHLLEFALRLQVELAGASTLEEALDRVRAAATLLKPGRDTWEASTATSGEGSQSLGPR